LINPTCASRVRYQSHLRRFRCGAVVRVGAQFCGSAVVRDAIQPCRTVRYLADSLNEQRSQREPAAASATFSAPTGANPLDDLRLAVVRALAAAPVILVVDGALGSDAVRLCELVRVRVRNA
jgi:hypothetical protein